MKIEIDKKQFWSCFGIFALAFVVRMVFDAWMLRNYPFYRYPSSDVQYYFAWAEKIAAGNWIGDRVFLGLPLYPYFLAVLERLFLGNLSGVRLAHLFLGALNCVLIYRIAYQIFSYRVALLAGIITALSFSVIYYDWLMMPPTLLVFLAAVIIIALFNRDKMRGMEWFFLGLTFGVSILGDGKFLLFLTGVLVYELIRNSKEYAVTVKTKLLPLVLGTFLIVALTGARNLFVSGQWVWISAQSGLNFYYGNNPEAKGYFENPDAFRPTHAGQDIDQMLAVKKELGRPVSPDEVSEFYSARALAFITGQPLQWGRLLLKKLHLFLIESEYTFDLDLIFLREQRLKWDFNPYPLLFPLALLGMWAARKNRKSDWLYLLIGAQLVFVLAFYLLNRYRASVVPFLIIFEAAALFWLAGQMRERNRLKAVAGLIFVLGYMFLFNTRFIDAKDYHFLVLSKAGYVLEDTDKVPLAQQAYQSALRLRPHDTTSLYNLGNTFVKQEKFAQAEAAYKKVIAQNPIHADAYFNLAVVYEKTDRWEKAKNAYRKVIELTPQSIDAHYRLGLLYAEKGQCDLARRHFDRVTAMNRSLRSEMETLLAVCEHP